MSIRVVIGMVNLMFILTIRKLNNAFKCERIELLIFME